jgi:hypothetical protein
LLRRSISGVWSGTWLVAPDGSGVASDFVNVWAAGKLVWQGSPAAAYDWPVHKAVEVAAVFSAALVTAALAALSWFVFGETSWTAFLKWIPTTSHVVLGQGGADFSRLQSLFGLVRTLGGGEMLAWQLQDGCAGLLAVTVMFLWHSGAAFELKAAALSCAALLATPYLYIYDLVALTIPWRFGCGLRLRADYSRAKRSDSAPRSPCCSVILMCRRKLAWQRR